MKNSHIALLVVLATSMISGVSAADLSGSTSAYSTGNTAIVTTQSEMPVLLNTLTVEDINTIRLQFNQPVRVESVRVRITDQQDMGTIRIASTTGATDKQTVVIKTLDPLTANGAYMLTMIEVFGTNNATLKSGIDSIKEFTVPATLAGGELSAPPNPNAVIVSTGAMTTTGAVSSGATLQTGSLTHTGTTVSPTQVNVTPNDPKKNPPEALPQTGVEMTLVIVMAALVAGILVFRRKRA